MGLTHGVQLSGCCRDSVAHCEESFSYLGSGEGSPERALLGRVWEEALFWGGAQYFLHPELQSHLVVTGREKTLPRTKLATADFFSSSGWFEGNGNFLAWRREERQQISSVKQ